MLSKITNIAEMVLKLIQSATSSPEHFCFEQFLATEISDFTMCD